MAGESPDNGVARGLALVTRFLAAEVARMRAAGVPVGEDDYRGLYVADTEADRIVRKLTGGGRDESALAPLRAELEALTAEPDGRVGQIVAIGGLAPFDLGCLLLCLAAEFDLECERLIAYTQDDVSKRRPRADLALRLFGDTACRDRLIEPAPLRRLRLIRLHDEPGQPMTPLAARYLSLDERVAGYLLGSSEIDGTLRAVARLEPPTQAPLPGGPRWAAIQRLAALPASDRPVALGLGGSDRSLLARATIALLPAPGGLLQVDFATLKAAEGLVHAFTIAAREARLQQAALCLEGLEALAHDETGQLCDLVTAETWARPIALAAKDGFPWPGVCIQVPDLDYEGRRLAWAEALAGQSQPVEPESLDAVAGRFRLASPAISDAARRATGLALALGHEAAALPSEDLFAGARSQSTPILSGLATKVVPHYVWDDIVLAQDTVDQLQEMRGQVEHRHLVYDTWGFDRKLASSKGLIALFAGQSGTGKTMAADVIANTLGLDLYRIDLSAVVSKYIGETEKNLGALFNEAAASNAVLFFDEADALFGKRSEVKDAHDRYANIETAYLLQRMEEYEGLVVLATNLKMNLDEAFLRRLQFVVDFPMPDEPQRRRIWQTTVPAEAPIAPDVDWDFLSRQFKIAGGNIRNAVLAGAFLAASDGGQIMTEHFVRGLRREYQKLGRMISDAEFGPYADLARRTS